VKRALAHLEMLAFHAVGQRANALTIWQLLREVLNAMLDNAITKLKVASNAHKVNVVTRNVVTANAIKIQANLFVF